jgi:hypothetical protein
MAKQAQHAEKAALFWKLAQEQYKQQATPFICMNLIMYTVGHLIESVLAEQGRHPGSPVRGVPHADRGALLRRYLVGEGKLDEANADCYGELVAQRDTFIDGGIQDRAFVERYMALAQPLIARLQTLSRPA